MTPRWLTVVEVCRSIEVEPHDRLMWTVGALVRDLYLMEHPEIHYALREKKNGGGSHMFAIYPPPWHARIAGVIRGLVIEEARQIDLFTWLPPPHHEGPRA